MKIINIMTAPPAYELFQNEPRPEINWNTPDGSWVGMWGLDVPDLLGTEILKLTNDFEYEVWQQDLRAEKVYTHTFRTGLVHKLFPATKKRKMYGFRVTNKIHSTILLRELLKRTSRQKIIVHLNGDPLLYQHLLPFLGETPVVLSYRGVIQLPSTRIFSKTKNFPSKVNLLREHYFLKKTINKIDCITYQNNENLSYLESIYRGPLRNVTSGCDFSFWRPYAQRVSRLKLGLPVNKKIFLSASLLNDLKQIDKLISVFDQLDSRHDFLLVVAGHGLKKYEDFLRDISLNLRNKNKIAFAGFLSGKKFRRYYNASDFFISTSRQEGGPVSAMQAFACEIPAILTNTGHTAELMEKYHCGCLLDRYDYETWCNEIGHILREELEVKPLDREIARKHYGWHNIARKFLCIYENLVRRYFN